MAKQESLLKLRGKVGDLSFSKHRNRGYEVRMKGGVDRQRILTDPNFQRTRENMNEFGIAVRKMKQLYDQLYNLIRLSVDRTVRNRLTSVVHRILKMDHVNPRGRRVFQDEHSGLLRDFEFNSNSSLKFLFAEPLENDYDRVSGQVELVIPPFNPLEHVQLLSGATHVQFTVAAARLGDVDYLPKPVINQTDFLPLIGAYPGAKLAVELPPSLPEVVYILVGISMFQEVNGQYYSLNNGRHNAMTIVAVDVPA